MDGDKLSTSSFAPLTTLVNGIVRLVHGVRTSHPEGIDIQPGGPFASKGIHWLYIADSPDEPTPFDAVSFLKIVGQGIGNNPQGRALFEVSRYGGIGIWDFLMIGGGGGAALDTPALYTAGPANGAMLTIGSDLGPNGLNQVIWGGAYHNDFLEMAIHNGTNYDQSDKRFRFCYDGRLLFGTLTDAGRPALRPGSDGNGPIIEARTADDSGGASIKATSFKSTSGYFQSIGNQQIIIGTENANFARLAASGFIFTPGDAENFAFIGTHGEVGVGGMVGLPAADATHRGALWTVKGAPGVADVTYQCLKSAADTYSWKAIVTG